VVGNITYPRDKARGLGIKHGWLFYVKPTMTGNEPEPVINYHQRYKEFPHQTTADQFYDEDQFEAHRRLGEFSVEDTIKMLLSYYKKRKTDLINIVRKMREIECARKNPCYKIPEIQPYFSPGGDSNWWVDPRKKSDGPVQDDKEKSEVSKEIDFDWYDDGKLAKSIYTGVLENRRKDIEKELEDAFYEKEDEQKEGEQKEGEYFRIQEKEKAIANLEKSGQGGFPGVYLFEPGVIEEIIGDLKQATAPEKPKP
jgi:hypothetical protein